MVGFQEKPSDPKPMPSDPARALSSMGNYLFSTETLMEALELDAKGGGSHDFGRDILPRLLKTHRVMAYNFQDNDIPGIAYHEEPGYWRDVGTVQAYWQANMDLLGDTPACDLRNREWPIRTEPSNGPPASLVNCYVDQAWIGEGSLLIEADVRRSIIGRNVRIEAGAQIEESVIFDHTHIGSGARLQRVVVDRQNKIQAGSELGGGDEVTNLPVAWTNSGLAVLPKPVPSLVMRKHRLAPH
jgi:glucose-1-phosphate adenylyltransferase